MPIITVLEYLPLEAKFTLKQDEVTITTITIGATGQWAMTARPSPATLAPSELMVILDDGDIFTNVILRRYNFGPTTLSDYSQELELKNGELTLKFKVGGVNTKITYEPGDGVTMHPRQAISGSFADWLVFNNAHRQFHNLVKQIAG